MNKGGAPRKDVEGGLLALIARAASAPESIPVGNVAIADAIGVSAATLRRRVRESELIKSLLEQLRDHANAYNLKQVRTGAARRDAAAHEEGGLHEDLGYEELDDRDIERKASHQFALARRAAERFRGRRAYHENLSDLPRAVFDLDRAVTAMLSALRELRPLTKEYISRTDGVAPSGLPVKDQIDFLKE